MNLLQVKKRNGDLVDYDRGRISVAVQKAFEAAGQSTAEADFDGLIDAIERELFSRYREASAGIEEIQDVVEKHLVRNDLYSVAKKYILYREERARRRQERQQQTVRNASVGKLSVVKRDGSTVPFDIEKVKATLHRAAAGLGTDVLLEDVLRETLKNIYSGISTADLEKAMVLAAVAYIERDPAYDTLATRIYLQRLYREIIGESVTEETLDEHYRRAFIAGIRAGIAAEAFTPELLNLDLDRLSEALDPVRDRNLRYLGIQTLSERYFVHLEGRLLETPQAFWMRAAMGLAIREDDPTTRAIEFYEIYSTLRFVSSTPTLFHSGLTHPQLSSCYLSTVKDDLTHIFKVIGDNAQLSKWSGGIGNDWTSIRGTGSQIHSTRVESQGVIPFLKIANDTTVAINRSGKRRGATCAYLETWHLDIEDFLDLRRNTGDDRRRTHDMNTANWIPDLFMKRVEQDSYWTLFSPDEVPDLHEIYGSEFEKAYVAYEKKAAAGEMRRFKRVEATKLWRKMLTRLFETGHPWITFKDPSNIRSPQDHAGVVHNSNLCTEITLNNSTDETAVCNLGSINLERHVTRDGGLDREQVAATVDTAMRMLDNVVDINFYPTVEAERSNLRHRPVGLGLMGFQDALFKLGLPFDSDGAAELADEIQELISYHAILGSSKLARERGAYESFRGSKWDRGIFPIDTVAMLEQERGQAVEVNRESRMDWAPVREHVRQYGMRNSNTMAIAPTATISNIAAAFPCIEPIYKNIYVKANMSGEFTIINRYLVADLKRMGLWSQTMLDKLKYYDGNVGQIHEIPAELRALYKEAFDIDPVAALRLTAVRSKWIDQSQSHNVFMKGVSGKKLDEIYRAAWRMGLKTTYYLRTLGASQIEKSTLDAKQYGYTQKREYTELDGGAPATPAPAEAHARAAAPAAPVPSEAHAATAELAATGTDGQHAAPVQPALQQVPALAASPSTAPARVPVSQPERVPASEAAPQLKRGALADLIARTGGLSPASGPVDTPDAPAAVEPAERATQEGRVGTQASAASRSRATPAQVEVRSVGSGEADFLNPQAGAGSEVTNVCSLLDPDCEACQ